MNRRSFLRALAIGAAAAAVDPEQLLWTPGQRTHILPPAGGWSPWRTMLHAAGPDAPTFIAWDPAAHGPDTVRYAMIQRDLTASEYAQFYGDFPPPQWREGIKAAAKELADRIDVDGLKLYEGYAKNVSFYEGDQWPRFTDREHAQVLQGIVDRIAQEPQIRAAINDEIRAEVWYGGRRAVKVSQLEARVRATMERLYDNVSGPGAAPPLVIDLTKATT
jgi:hypothetical protein